MPTGDDDGDDLPPGWDESTEEGTVVGPSGDREPEPVPGAPDAQRSEQHREQAEEIEHSAEDSPDADRDEGGGR